MGAIKLDIRQLPHAAGLPLPAYQSAHAAGLDLLAAVPDNAPLVLASGKHATMAFAVREPLQGGRPGSTIVACVYRDRSHAVRIEEIGHKIRMSL